jgi:hypothetical protein
MDQRAPRRPPVTGFRDPERLRPLARWADEFEQPGFSIGEWAGGERDESGVIQMPYVAFSNDGERFVSEMYAHEWVYSFDWMAWAGTKRGRTLLGDPDRIARVAAADLARLLTTIIRGDRFSEGSITQAHESGMLAAIARRARVLLLEAEAEADR